jgi:hypothetical protein
MTRRYTSHMKLTQILCTAALLCASVSTFAQWQWIDKDGRKVYSDRPPPTDVADKNILKRPAGMQSKPVVAEQEAPNSASVTPSTSTKPSAPAAGAGVDKELEAKKKALADAEAAKKKAEEEKIAKARADNCARAKQAKAALDSGIRMSQVNASGEREIMDEGARAAEGKRLQGIINSDCK